MNHQETDDDAPITLSPLFLKGINRLLNNMLRPDYNFTKLNQDVKTIQNLLSKSGEDVYHGHNANHNMVTMAPGIHNGVCNLLDHMLSYDHGIPELEGDIKEIKDLMITAKDIC